MVWRGPFLFYSGKIGGSFLDIKFSLITEKRGSFLYFLWKWGVFSIFANLKKGGLSGRAYPYTVSMGVPPPGHGDVRYTSLQEVHLFTHLPCRHLLFRIGSAQPKSWSDAYLCKSHMNHNLTMAERISKIDSGLVWPWMDNIGSGLVRTLYHVPARYNSIIHSNKKKSFSCVTFYWELGFGPL